MKDLLLTQDGDLFVSDNGDVEFTDSVAQAIIIRLKWFLGEWRINKTYGVPYYDEVFVKNPSTALLEDRLRTEILTVEGVASVDNVSVSIDKITRVAKIKFSATSKDGATETGEVKLNV